MSAHYGDSTFWIVLGVSAGDGSDNGNCDGGGVLDTEKDTTNDPNVNPGFRLKVLFGLFGLFLPKSNFPRGIPKG